MNDPDPATRTATAVSFLDSDPVAQRLALAWPQVPTDLTGRRLTVVWARAAGVAVSATARLGPALRAHGLCREDRTLDVEARRVLQHVAAESLRGRRRRG